MDEAIDLAIEDCSPYPDCATFIDADSPSAGWEDGEQPLNLPF